MNEKTTIDALLDCNVEKAKARAGLLPPGRSQTVGRASAKRTAAGLLASVLLLQTAQAAPCTAPLSGANAAGGEFNAGRQPGVFAHDYVYPAAGEAALLKRLGLKAMRVPVLWERLQPQPSTALDAVELGRLDAVVGVAQAAGLITILDVHNFGAYRGISLGDRRSPPGALPDLWKRLALHYREQPAVAFGLMNEPNDIDVDAWAAIAKDTLAAIRSTGAANVVIVPGTHWDGAHSWLAPSGPHSNASALLPLARDDSAVVFEVHQYFDGNYSGTAETCTGASAAVAAIAAVGTWARTNHVRLFLGEFGVSKRPECVAALDAALATIEHDRDAWYGWTYWAAGAWWGDYMFSIQATNGDTPQGAVLQARAKTLDAAARASCESAASPAPPKR